MAISDWPLAERPREKLLAKGAAALSDAELLAIFLRTGVPGKTAVDLARDVLQSTGGLRALLAAEQREFCGVKGLGVAKYVQLQAVLEISRRYLLEDLQRDTLLSSPKATRDYLALQLTGMQHEVFVCLFVDAQNQLLAYEQLFEGTLDGASVYPREVLKRVLFHNAAAVIFAHNHPSGIAEPSQADHRITERLKQALGLIDVRVLDHLIVANGATTSFAERGWL